MILALEYKKVKRTGFVPAIIAGGVLSAMVPIVNMAVRAELYTGQSKPPIQILLEANWQMMAMLNILLVTIGACVMYNTEYLGNAIQKMRTLPVDEGKLFLGKSFLLMAMCAAVLLIEGGTVAFCTAYWFQASGGVIIEISKNFLYSFLLMLPVILLSLLIASMCSNMWISLGIAVICISIATMLPVNKFILSLFPFALPYQIFAGTAKSSICSFAVGAILECACIVALEIVFLKVRRLFV